MSAPASASPDSYRERLTPPVLWFVVAAVIGGSFGLVVLPFAGPPGFLIGAMVGAAVGVAVLVLTSAGVEAADGTLRAGRAAIPVHLLGRVTVVAPEDMSLLRGRDFEPRAYVCQRAWLAGGVLAQVDDAADPTPYWLISSKRPQRLADAIEAQR